MIDIITEKDVPIQVRDGLKLAANVSRPDKPGKYPVIMAFTAFAKDVLWSPHSVGWGFADEPYSPTITGTAVFEAEDPAFWVRHEYVLIIVDPRGFNAIEWAGTQEWSNGSVGLSGVSILAFSQWRTAALKPPHLKAFIPWEGMTDFYRDVMFRGGIPETEWGKLISDQRVSIDRAWPPPEREDPPAPDEKTEDDFLADITTPALLCATWSNQGNHTRGAFRAFRNISSRQKWLYTHGRQEWAEFYNTEAQALRKLFFDHFLKGIDNRIVKVPPVRLETRENADKYTVRYAEDFPIPGTEYEKLYLDATDYGLKVNNNQHQGKAS